MEDREPNWKVIIESAIWQEEIHPWLDRMYWEALEKQCPVNPEAPPMEEYHYWRGHVAALKMMRDMAYAFLQANEFKEAQEKKDAIIREQAQRRRGARRPGGR